MYVHSMAFKIKKLCILNIKDVLMQKIYNMVSLYNRTNMFRYCCRATNTAFVFALEGISCIFLQ